MFDWLRMTITVTGTGACYCGCHWYKSLFLALLLLLLLLPNLQLLLVLTLLPLLLELLLQLLPVSVKQILIGRRTHIEIEACRAPNQGLESSFCCGIAGQRLTWKGIVRKGKGEGSGRNTKTCLLKTDRNQETGRNSYE